MTLDISKIGQAKADEVVEKFSNPDFKDTEPLTNEECLSLGFDDQASDHLVAILGNGKDGFVTPEELQRLRDAGFGDKFVNVFAKDNGAYALNKRVTELSRLAVTRLFRIDYPTEQAYSIRELGKIGGKYAEPSTPYLKEVIEDCQSSWGIVRRAKGCEPDFLMAAADALGNIGHLAKPALPALKKAAKEWPVEKKASAILALAKIGTAREVLGIIVNEGLENKESWGLRLAACQAVGILGVDAAEVGTFLVKIINDKTEEPRVRREALLSLGQIIHDDSNEERLRKAVLASIQALGANDFGIQNAARTSLKGVGFFAISYLIDTLKNSKEETAVQMGSAEVLGEIVYQFPEDSPVEIIELVVNKAIPTLIQFL